MLNLVAQMMSGLLLETEQLKSEGYSSCLWTSRQMQPIGIKLNIKVQLIFLVFLSVPQMSILIVRIWADLNRCADINAWMIS